jgi:hypothetical protein
MSRLRSTYSEVAAMLKDAFALHPALCEPPDRVEKSLKSHWYQIVSKKEAT